MKFQDSSIQNQVFLDGAEKLNRIVGQLVTLEERIESFKGDKNNEEYRNLDLKLNQNLRALYKIRCDGFSKEIEEWIKSVHHYISILDSKAKEQTKKTDTMIPHLKVPDQSVGSKFSVGTDDVAVLNVDDPKWLKMVEIMETFDNLEKEVSNFEANEDDKQYKFLDEMLTRKLLALDSVDISGRSDLKQKRKEFIKRINLLLSNLESKAKKQAKLENLLDQLETEITCIDFLSQHEHEILSVFEPEKLARKSLKPTYS